MEEDTRKPKHSSTGARALQDDPRATSANIMPGGMANTAGGAKVEDYSWWSVLTSIHPNEYWHFARLPCVRDALLVGIATGCVGAGASTLMRRRVSTTIKYFMPSFAIPTWGMYEYCSYQRRREKSGVKRAVEIMDQKRVDKEKRASEQREKRRLKEEEERKAMEELRRQQSRWWKFW